MEIKTNGIEDTIRNYWSEIFPIERGLRSTSIVEVADRDVEFYTEFFNSRGVLFEIVTVKTLNEERAKRKIDPLRDYINENLFYIGDEIRKIKTLIDGDFNNDFFCVGMMLGYPECCISAFFRRGTESIDVDKLKRRFPLITHIPCAENCERTAAYHAKLLKDIEECIQEKKKNP